MNYQPFVVITYPRSGTHMLRTSLNQHPSIVCAGECFNPNKPDLPYGHSTPTKTIFEQYIYPQYPSNIQCAGFVHHAYHPFVQQAWPSSQSNAAWEDIWKYLTGMPDLKIIYLYRDNLVWRHLSQVMAHRTGHWQTFIDEDTAKAQGKRFFPKPKKTDPVDLDLQLMQHDFSETLEYRRKMQVLFKSHLSLEVTYESLCNSFDHQMKTVLSFLSLENHQLSPELIKLEDRKMSTAISNYSELKNAFRDTPAARFFID